jgi:hypothetical protein
MSDYEVEFTWNGFDIKAYISHDPGCHTQSNGDPGWPESWDIDGFEVAVNGVRLPKDAEDLITSDYYDDLAEIAMEEARN